MMIILCKFFLVVVVVVGVMFVQVMVVDFYGYVCFGIGWIGSGGE